MNTFETQYLNVLNDILENGEREPNRTGIDTLATWGQSLSIDLGEGFPILTSRKINLRISFEEMMFFLRGDTDTKKLEDKKINIWNGNTSREFLDNRGLHYLPEGHYGKSYGFQWRHFGGEYKENVNPSTYQYVTDYTTAVGGTDQVINLLNSLTNDPNGRRHIISAWNPSQLHEMALPPCHILQQYQISNGKLNSMMLQRSVDTVFGWPYNITGYALLNHIFAKYLKLTPGKLVIHGNDVHVYTNQINMAKEQLSRRNNLFKLPELLITKDLNDIEDIFTLEYSDIQLNGYVAHPDIKNKPPMAI